MIEKEGCCTCLLLEGLGEELYDDVVEVSASEAPVAHCGEHSHVLLDEVYYRHAVALERVWERREKMEKGKGEEGRER